MRQWGIDTALLCRKHLLGEHVECHMALGTLRRGTRVKGYIEKKLLKIGAIHIRHEQLAKEIERRGMKHNSPMTKKDELLVKKMAETYISNLGTDGKLDIAGNIEELKKRCKQCNKNILNLLKK